MKKETWKFGLSIGALILSILACFITWLKGGHIENDTFVGIMAGLMGVCATIIVGAQIYNSIDTQNKIKELNKLFENKIRESQKIQDELKDDLAKIKIELNEVKATKEYAEHFTKYNVNFSLATFHYQTDLYMSYHYFFKALQEALEIKNNNYVQNALTNMENICNLIVKQSKKGTKSFDIKEHNPQKLKDYYAYVLIKDQYEKIYNTLLELNP